MKRVDIGVFAHNEAHSIGTFLSQLFEQTIFQSENFDARVLVLANGCSDETVAVAIEHIEGRPIKVLDIVEPGKSRTWDRFVHAESRETADILIFCDADITFVDDQTLSNLCGILLDQPNLMATSSLPIKDIVHAPGKLSFIERLIASAGGTLDNWKTSICGQLYAMRSEASRSFRMPIGLPVEDGFVRAMTLTQTLSEPEDLSRIDGREHVFHVYESERTIGALIRHQTRIVIGSAINAVLFQHLRSLPKGRSVPDELARAAEDPVWLSATLHRHIPSWRHGWVPFHFLTKRMLWFIKRGGRPRNPKALFMLTAGFGFDLIVFLRAQIMMARGIGPGFW